MRRRLWIVAALALTGCPMLSGKGQTTPSFKTPSLSSPGIPAGGGSDDRVVPNLIGKTREEAIALVAAAGFDSPPESNRVVECEDAAKDEGKINCQDPYPGQVVKKYTMIAIHVYGRMRINGAIVRDQLEQLIGVTPDEAKAKLRSFGHDGEVKVEASSKFYEKCADGKVCDISRPFSGMGVHDDITLYTQKGLKIVGPK